MLKQKTILVTGASSGIGRITARVLSESGARVLLTGRNLGALEATAQTLVCGQHRTLPKELGGLDDAYEWITDVASEYGPLDGLVHCAGLRSGHPIRMIKQAHFQKVMSIHGEVSLGLIKGFRKNRTKGLGGSIVLVSSVLGLLGTPLEAVYCAAKAAMIGIARASALELAREGLRVNCVAPGYVNSEMLDEFKASLTEEQFRQIESRHPLGIGDPVDIANAVAFLLSDQSKWITGTTLVVDGGYSAQ